MNQTALITGAGSGIGRAVAVSLDGIGLRVALVGRDRAKLEETRAELSEPGRATALVVPCDVADRAAVTAMAERVLAELGAIDVLVCNAGTNVRHRSLETLDPADWDRMIATNLTGAYNLVHAVLPAMRARGKGLVVQICSISGKRASVLGGAGYSASKFGQAALGICLGREEGPHGIRSTRDLPGRGQHADPRRPPRAGRSRAARGDPPAVRRRGRGPLPGRAPPPRQHPRADHQADRR